MKQLVLHTDVLAASMAASSDIAACLPTSDWGRPGSQLWAFLSSDGVKDGHHGEPAITRDREVNKGV